MVEFGGAGLGLEGFVDALGDIGGLLVDGVMTPQVSQSKPYLARL